MKADARWLVAALILAALVCVVVASDDDQPSLGKAALKRRAAFWGKYKKSTVAPYYEPLDDEPVHDADSETATFKESTIRNLGPLKHDTCNMGKLTVKATTWNLGEGNPIPSVSQFAALLRSTAPTSQSSHNLPGTATFAEMRGGDIHHLKGQDFRVRPHILAFGLQEFRSTKKTLADDLKMLRTKIFQAIVDVYGDYYDDALDGGVENHDRPEGVNVPAERIEGKQQRRLEKSVSLLPCSQGTQVLLVFTHRACREKVTFKAMMKKMETNKGIFTGKGGVGAIFDLAYPSREDGSTILHKPLTFMTTHLPSGDTKIEARNSALNSLLNYFEDAISRHYEGDASGGIEFLMGDMNYRLQNIETGEATSAIEAPSGIPRLLSHDEYLISDDKIHPLKARKFSEYRIMFPPSYKHMPISEREMERYAKGEITDFTLPEKGGVSVVRNGNYDRPLVYITKNTKTSLLNGFKKGLGITGEFHTPSYTDRVFVRAGDDSQWFCGNYVACLHPMCASSDHIPVTITAAFDLNNVIAGTSKIMHYYMKDQGLVGEEMHSPASAILGHYDDVMPESTHEKLADWSQTFQRLRDDGILPPAPVGLKRALAFRGAQYILDNDHDGDSGDGDGDGEHGRSGRSEGNVNALNDSAEERQPPHEDSHPPYRMGKTLPTVMESDDEYGDEPDQHDVDQSIGELQAEYSATGARDVANHGEGSESVIQRGYRLFGGAANRIAHSGLRTAKVSLGGTADEVEA